MDESEQVSKVFEKLGASPEQASRMAKQLVKRARQQSELEKTSFLEALDRLMRLSIGGAQGDFDPNFQLISKKSQKS